MYVVDVVIFL